MIEITGLYKKFGKVEVLQNLDLTINQGGIYAILGPNGSGKTTLIKSILSMVFPTKGEIKINGENVIGKYAYRNQINYLPQIAQFPGNLTVIELISMIKNLRGAPATDSFLINHFRLEPYLDKKLGNLSGGTKQKVNLVLAFMFDTNLIILDEPTSGLDPVSLIRLKEIIRQEKEKGKTILITTHIIGLVEEIADEIIFILEGKIYFKGTVAELQQQTKQSNLEYAIAHILESHHV